MMEHRPRLADSFTHLKGFYLRRLERKLDIRPDTSASAARRALEIVQRPGMEQFRGKK